LGLKKTGGKHGRGMNKQVPTKKEGTSPLVGGPNRLPWDQEKKHSLGKFVGKEGARGKKVGP